MIGKTEDLQHLLIQFFELLTKLLQKELNNKFKTLILSMIYKWVIWIKKVQLIKFEDFCKFLNIIEKRYKEKFIATFIDIEKMFDSINWNILFEHRL